jgi:hypothetical protein
MSAQLMGLVRELKALNARKKAGEELSAPEETRRKELKTFLKAQLEGAGGGDESMSEARPATSMPSGAPVASPAPAPAPPPRPAPVAAAPPPRPAPLPVPQVRSAPAAVPAAVPSAAASPVAPPPRPASTFVPKKDAYAIGGAAAFIDAAINSDAVKKTDGWSHRKALASDVEIADAEAAADAAIRATKKRAHVTSPEEVEAQLQEISGGYTPPDNDFVLEQYYGDYFSEGLALASVAESAELKPIDPREMQFRQALDVAIGSGAGATNVTVPPGMSFLDDFAALYTRRVLAPPADEASAAAADDPTLLIGKRKVTVHLLNGEKKQGSVRALRRGELGMKIENGGQVEEIGLMQVKAVFVHLQPNAQQVSTGGRMLTVLFRDQRAVQGESTDYEPSAQVFSLVPPAGRGQFEKIIINAAAVSSVT